MSSLRCDVLGNCGKYAMTEEEELEFLRENASIFTRFGRRCRMLLKNAEKHQKEKAARR